ncbi:mitochondrial large ribosomal subunit protein uL30m [Phanerochaete sordida]|uniref:Large ribosomal subunit protein uL30m n=1 Tax=Phanerochaete sordida TaxID=48140 RepID=A0A9P3G0F9_9APHY|nr:mitochondrial large ribosomal subunit protein uL30m [Phanerochaete sordida]
MALATLGLRAHALRAPARSSARTLALRALSNTAAPASEAASAPPSKGEPLTHYRITSRRSAISLLPRLKATLVSLGIHRRHQTVYHEHSPINAGKILRVKELVEVENVPASAVRTKTEQRLERKAPRGYKVLGSKLQEVV